MLTTAHRTAHRVRDLRDTPRGDKSHARIRGRSTRARPRRKLSSNHERESDSGARKRPNMSNSEAHAFFRASRVSTCELNTWPTHEYLVQTRDLCDDPSVPHGSPCVQGWASRHLGPGCEGSRPFSVHLNSVSGSAKTIATENRRRSPGIRVC